jgi:hypothetical protein
MAFRARAGDDDHDDDDDLEDGKVRLGALEEAVSKLADSGGEGGTYNAHAPQQQSTMPVPAEPAGFTAEILRAKLELAEEIHKVGKELADETNAKLEGMSAKLEGMNVKLEGTSVKLDETNAKLEGTSVKFTNVTGEIAGVRLELQGLRGEINTQGAVLQGQITALQSDMTEVKEGIAGIHEGIEGIHKDITGLTLAAQGHQGEMKVEMMSLRQEVNSSLIESTTGLKAGIAGLSHQIYLVGGLLVFVLVATGKMSVGEATALFGK